MTTSSWKLDQGRERFRSSVRSFVSGCSAGRP